MDNIKTQVVNGTVAVGGGLVSYLFGEWTPMLQFLAILLVADYGTGVAAAYITGKLSSKAGAVGLLKKVAYITAVIVAHHADVALSQNWIQSAVVFGFISNELISLTENFAVLGVKLPKEVTDRLAQIQPGQKKGDNNDESI